MKNTTIIFCILLMLPIFAITAAANQPPSAPTIEGPTSGNVGAQITYGFCSADPDGDNITITINWGDGSGEIYIGPFVSGLCVTASHIWLKKGTYTIKAKASDGQAESNWSSLEITIPRSKFIQNTPVFRLFVHFPNAFLMIRQLLGL